MRDNTLQERIEATLYSAGIVASGSLAEAICAEIDFQPRVAEWAEACFLTKPPKIERVHRFVEEALELAQSLDCTQHEVEQLVAYVYGRPLGEPAQEVGGVALTLALLCEAHDLDLTKCSEDELDRVWNKIEKIRAKQAAKPVFSPLPE